MTQVQERIRHAIQNKVWRIYPFRHWMSNEFYSSCLEVQRGVDEVWHFEFTNYFSVIKWFQ